MVAMKENSETVEEDTDGVQEERYAGLEVDYFLEDDQECEQHLQSPCRLNDNFFLCIFVTGLWARWW